MTPEDLFRVLSDPTRLRAMMLIQAEGEVCVCELTHALRESQPKISRHLAFMRDAGLVKARRQGTWMHYRLDSRAPAWAREIIDSTCKRLREMSQYRQDIGRLHGMKNRPEKHCA